MRFEWCLIKIYLDNNRIKVLPKTFNNLKNISFIFITNNQLINIDNIQEKNKLILSDNDFSKVSSIIETKKILENYYQSILPETIKKTT